MKFKIYFLSFIAVCFSAYFSYPYLLKTEPRDAKIKEIFQQSDIYGNKITGYGNKKFIIVNFWATWCPPCVEETPSLVRFAEKNEKDFYLVALSQDDSKKAVFSFIKTFPSLKSGFINIIHDSSQAIARSFKVNRLPETFIYSVEKNQYIQFSGATDWDAAEVMDSINQAFRN